MLSRFEECRPERVKSVCKRDRIGVPRIVDRHTILVSDPSNHDPRRGYQMERAAPSQVDDVASHLTILRPSRCVGVSPKPTVFDRAGRGSYLPLDRTQVGTAAPDRIATNLSQMSTGDVQLDRDRVLHLGAPVLPCFPCIG